MNRLLAAAAVLIVVGGLVLLVAPAGHIPLLDANRQVLAETAESGYCAGKILVQTRGQGSEEGMADCLATETMDESVDLRAVQPAFCRGIVEMAGWDQAACMDTVSSQQIWPTMKGTWTNAWNRRFPYPLSELAGVPNQGVTDESRTGDREGNQREGFDRGE